VRQEKKEENMDKRKRVFRVPTDRLPEATAAMNYTGDFFRSRVCDVIPQGPESLVVVELDGSYPFIENEWEVFIITAKEPG